MKILKIAFILAISCQLGHAQSFQLIKATRQGWSGGVAGHYGVNYYIELTTTSQSATPDTVWINGNAYPLDIKPKEGNATRSVDSVKHRINYAISVGEAHNEFNKSLYTPPNDTAGKKSKPVRHFEGAAMVSYMLKHKQHFFMVKSFTELPRLNYP